ncbi:hypothetical protein M5X06_27980 [Paenibacillus alvei]|uniref:Uncharacterized protein n=1 Tax=Paenibacillus alvei TaxID=44250 RepID=A0ABT4GR66_PAEAL|nr:hypothetical protein [Paenibacillus alvei]MCY9758946.1 hypothetical protein [Paenibacillus alvei]MCY9770619.1 hypothetical protein [Paenibacillus alvei]
MKRRTRNKCFKRVATGLRTGAPIPNFYIDKVGNELLSYFDHKYSSVFQSWWYDHLELQDERNLSKELERFSNGVRDSFGELTGIDMKQFEIVAKARREQKRRVYGPKKLRRRKAKEKPVRKFKRPEQFSITIRGGRSHIVIGERVFQHKGFHFFIYRQAHPYADYVVTDVLTGMAVARHDRYKKAVEIARTTIKEHFDLYLSQVKTIKRLRLGGSGSE